jgi:putative heme iron utilization protein
MGHILEALVTVVMFVLLIADIRAVVLLYRAKKGNEEQRKRLHKQIKEFSL